MNFATFTTFSIEEAEKMVRRFLLFNRIKNYNITEPYSKWDSIQQRRTFIINLVYVDR